jgi:hypothetical protein
MRQYIGMELVHVLSNDCHFWFLFHEIYVVPTPVDIESAHPRGGPIEPRGARTSVTRR